METVETYAKHYSYENHCHKPTDLHGNRKLHL